jgi:hypothetical protein
MVSFKSKKDLKDLKMTDEKRKRLEEAGFRVGTIAEFLDLTPEEQAKIDNMIIRHGKPIGFCECKGKGKESCRGNGWIRDGAGFQKCPYFDPNN